MIPNKITLLIKVRCMTGFQLGRWYAPVHEYKREQYLYDYSLTLLKGRGHLEDLRVGDGVLKWIWKKWDVSG
jgi:hypothetical protein